MTAESEVKPLNFAPKWQTLMALLSQLQITSTAFSLCYCTWSYVVSKTYYEARLYCITRCDAKSTRIWAGHVNWSIASIFNPMRCRSRNDGGRVVAFVGLGGVWGKIEKGKRKEGQRRGKKGRWEKGGGSLHIWLPAARFLVLLVTKSSLIYLDRRYLEFFVILFSLMITCHGFRGGCCARR